jgi:hypothetical protein
MLQEEARMASARSIQSKLTARCSYMRAMRERASTCGSIPSVASLLLVCLGCGRLSVNARRCEESDGDFRTVAAAQLVEHVGDVIAVVPGVMTSASAIWRLL